MQSFSIRKTYVRHLPALSNMGVRKRTAVTDLISKASKSEKESKTKVSTKGKGTKEKTKSTIIKDEEDDSSVKEVPDGKERESKRRTGSTKGSSTRRSDSKMKLKRLKSKLKIGSEEKSVDEEKVASAIGRTGKIRVPSIEDMLGIPRAIDYSAPVTAKTLAIDDKRGTGGIKIAGPNPLSIDQRGGSSFYTRTIGAYDAFY